MRRVMTSIKDFIVQEYKFLIFLVLLYFILQMNVNYYIITGGEINNISSRIEVEDKYEAKGSFNISYVKELAKSNVMGYLLSYIIPGWERENASSYKYYDKESLRDIAIRSELDLQTANGNATFWAYTLANKEIELIDTELYVNLIFPDYDNGLKVGDQIISVNNNAYQTVEEYKQYFQSIEEDEIVIKIIRNGKEKEIKSKLREENKVKVLGVGLQQVKKYETDPKVKIQFKKTESGPSAGLITTLEIYNQLIKKDITNGLKIAGTGTIEEDGSIGQIGGIEHKLYGASHAKADLFLSPSGKNYEDAIKYKKEKNLKIKIIEVKTIEEAIKILEDLS